MKPIFIVNQFKKTNNIIKKGLSIAMISVAVPALSLINGCASTHGPQLVVNSHVDYNKAVSQVVSQELLLNIVRRRYYEAPQFVTVASISSNISTSGNIGANFSFDNNIDFSNGRTGSTLNSGVTFSDSPTITITPRAGEEIAGPLTARMSHVSVAKMANAGYRFDMLLALMVQNITGVCGPQTGVGDAFYGGSPEYVELIEKIGLLIEKNQLIAGTFSWEDPYSSIAYQPEHISPEQQIAAVAATFRWRSFDDGKSFYLTDKQMYPAMWISEKARMSGDGKRVIELLNLQTDPLKKIWTFAASKVVEGSDLNWETDKPRHEVKMLVRSFYSVMNFLAYGVQVPPQDEQEGRAFSKTCYEQAVKENRTVDLAEYFVVHWSKEHPENAFVAVQHREKWFYIDDRDYVSKRFFNAVYDLFNLEIAPSGGSGGPVLTLPVN